MDHSHGVLGVIHGSCKFFQRDAVEVFANLQRGCNGLTNVDLLAEIFKQQADLEDILSPIFILYNVSTDRMATMCLQ